MGSRRQSVHQTGPPSQLSGCTPSGCRSAPARPALLLPAPALRRRELPDVTHPALEDGRDLRVRLAAFLGLVGEDWRLHELPHHALERVVRALELGRVVDGARRARLAAEAAVHALRHVDVEAGHDETAGGLVLRGVDHDAVDRAGALAGEAGGADLEVDLEHAAVTEGSVSCTRTPSGRRSGYCTV